MKKKIILIGIIVIALLMIYTALNTCYHADKSMESYLVSTDTVKVEKIKEGYFFDGPGKDAAFIFYPGAQVEYTAYASLLFNTAELGIDTFLIKMPLNYAFLGSNKATSIIKKYNYDSFFMGGHSLGGAMAANYTSRNKDKIKGLILLAAYSTSKIPEKIPVLSIYGTNDTVLNEENYKKYLTNLKNVEELEIEGGIHAYFGYYSKQKHDGHALITREEQQQTTNQAIKKFINKNKK